MNADPTDFKIGLIVGVLMSGVGLFVLWHMLESECQAKHNVSDCEWAQSPFLPSPAVEAPDA